MPCDFQWRLSHKGIAPSTLLVWIVTLGETGHHILRTLQQHVERRMWGGTGASHHQPEPNCQPCEGASFHDEAPETPWLSPHGRLGAEISQLSCLQAPVPEDQEIVNVYFFKPLSLGAIYYTVHFHKGYIWSCRISRISVSSYLFNQVHSSFIKLSW